MSLSTTAYLEVEASTNATFELNIGLQHTSTLSKGYLMGARGQYLGEIVNQTPGTGSFDASRRTGFWIDGGAGDWQPQIDFQTGQEDVQWGDSSGGTGPSNVTDKDASGANVKAISRLQVLQNWLARSRSDSEGKTKLHWGEWTDGSIAHVTNPDAGAFGKPMPVAVIETQFRGVDVNEDAASMEGSITFSHVAMWGGINAPDWADSAQDAIDQAAEVLTDA